MCFIFLTISAFGYSQEKMRIWDCIDYTDLQKASCFAGTTAFIQYGKRQPIDYGPASDKSRHTVHTDITEMDPRTGGLLHTTAPDGRPAVRLGNWLTGAEAEGITYSYIVDSVNYPILVLQYACVMEDPHHALYEQPRTTMFIYDQDGMPLNDQCSKYYFAAGYGDLQGWNYLSNDRCWKDWTTMGLDLSAYHGQKLRIEFITYDCSLEGHYGYSYFALGCTTKKMRYSSCGGGEDSTTFIAPDGFRYKWFKEGSAQALSNRQSYSAANSDNATYICRVYNKENDECWFELTAKAHQRLPQARFNSYLRMGLCADTVYVSNESFVSDENGQPYTPNEECEDFFWDFGNGQTSTERDPGMVVYTTPGTYTIKLVTGLNDWKCVSDTITATYTLNTGARVRESFDTICAGEYIQRGAYSYSSEGVFRDTTIGENCIDTLIMTEHLHLLQPIVISETYQLCFGESYEWHGRTLNKPGIYYDSLVTYKYHCDSIHQLTLSLLPIYRKTESAQICYGEEYVWHGHPLLRAGIYIDSLQSRNGCDSIIILNLSYYTNGVPLPADVLNELVSSTILSKSPHTSRQNAPGRTPPASWDEPYPDVEDTIPIVIPDSWEDPFVKEVTDTTIEIVVPPSWEDPYLHSHQDEDDVPFVTPGTWKDPFPAIHEDTTDSIMIPSPWLDPFVTDTTQIGFDVPGSWDDPYIVRIEYDTICGKDIYVHNGYTYTESGIYQETLSNRYGCDSVVYLVLEFYHSYFYAEEDSIPQGKVYSWHGHDYTESGVYYDSLLTVAGCDSIYQLTLTVSGCEDVYTYTDVNIKPDELPYTWNGTAYNESGQYLFTIPQETGCDSISVLRLHVLDECEIPITTLPIKANRDTHNIPPTH